MNSGNAGAKASIAFWLALRVAMVSALAWQVFKYAFSIAEKSFDRSPCMRRCNSDASSGYLFL